MVPLASTVGQTAMVSRDSKGGTALPQPAAFRSPGGGVVNLRPSVQPALERSGILSQVVGQPSKPPLALRTKGRGKPGAQSCCPIQMLLNRLLSFILRFMGKEFFFHQLISLLVMSFQFAASRWWHE